VPPNFVAQAPPPHYHTRDEEAFYVLEGTITFQISGKDVRAPSGSVVQFPRHLIHKFSNPDPLPAAILVMGSPSGIEDYLVEVYQLLQQPGPPDPAKMQAIFEKYGLFITLASSKTTA
jgi:mannose-6-phosphate isomerase-like protein (cupin superfamily)